MYRTISRSSSGLIRQSTARLTRQLSTTRTTPSQYNSKLLLGVLGTGALAFGYFSQQSSLIQNASTVENIEKVFEEGNAVAKDAQESLDARQEKVIKENEQKTKKQKMQKHLLSPRQMSLTRKATHKLKVNLKEKVNKKLHLIQIPVKSIGTVLV